METLHLRKKNMKVRIILYTSFSKCSIQIFVNLVYWDMPNFVGILKTKHSFISYKLRFAGHYVSHSNLVDHQIERSTQLCYFRFSDWTK